MTSFHLYNIRFITYGPCKEWVLVYYNGLRSKDKKNKGLEKKHKFHLYRQLFIYCHAGQLFLKKITLLKPPLTGVRLYQ